VTVGTDEGFVIFRHNNDRILFPCTN